MGRDERSRGGRWQGSGGTAGGRKGDGPSGRGRGRHADRGTARPDARGTDPTSYFFMCLKNQRPFNDKLGIKRFADSALAVSSDELLRNLGRTELEGLSRLREICAAGQSFRITPLNEKQEVGFLHVIVPLLSVLVQPSIKNSNLTHIVNPILSIFTDSREFLAALLRCLPEACRHNFPASDPSEGNANGLPNCPADVLRTVTAFLRQILTRFPAAAHDSLPQDLVAALRKDFRAFAPDDRTTGVDLQVCERYVTEALRQEAQHAADEAAKARAQDRLAMFDLDHSRRAPARSRFSFGHMRHNNDFENFRQINIMPSQEEVLCNEEPFLPANTPGAEDHLEPGRIDRVLDTHFSGLQSLGSSWLWRDADDQSMSQQRK